jgi:hypothetical protein
MPRLWGEQLSKKELLERVGNVAQVGGLRRVRLLEGVEDGIEAIELRTGTGFDLDILPSRGLDLGAARFNGQALSWLSSAGFAHPGLSESTPDAGFLRAFGGGLLTTCGLSNVGNPNVDEGIQYGQHGRASSTPAFEVAAWGEWINDEYVMTVRGKTREAVLYGDKLEKTRTIRAHLGQARIELEDVVENIGSKPAALMVLYHMNLGWPLIGPGSRLDVPSAKRTVKLGTGINWETMPAPDSEYAVNVIEHEMTPDADGRVRLNVTSKSMRLEIAYEIALNRFTQWQQFGSGDYVLGLEPGNVGVQGRAAERASGTLPMLEPGTRKIFSLQVTMENLS